MCDDMPVRVCVCVCVCVCLLSLFEYFKMVYFSEHLFSDLKKKTLDYSIWFLSNLTK